MPIYEGFQDAITAILVIVIVSFIIAVAWLSTNVREQPLIATAVVVFQSGVNGDGDRNTSSSDTVQSENLSSGTQEGEAVSVQSAPSVKENENSNISESPVMEVGQQTAKLSNVSENEDVMNVDNNLCAKNSETLSDKECDIEAEASVLVKDEVQCCSQEPAAVQDNHAKDSTRSHNPSEVSSSSQKEQDVSQEMEVRNRRLQHFLSMGESPMTETHHKDSTPQEDANDNHLKSSLNDDSKGESGEGNGLPSSSTSSPPPVQSAVVEERPPGSIRIRLKFLDETQKFVFAQLTEQVGSFKRQHFSIEMDANRRIRLIFNGHLLNQDSSTLAQCGLFDNCVVHCHVSQPQQLGHNSGQSRDLHAQDDEDAYVSGLLAPLLYCVMVVMWYLRYEYSHLFNTMSTIILMFLTALLLISTYLLYITQNVPGSDSAAQISSRHQIETNSLL